MKSVGSDRVLVPWTQRAGGDQVDRPAEGGLELVGERDEVEADLGVDVDENVDVASIGLVAARKRAEEGQVAHAETATELGLHRPKNGDDLIAGPSHDEPSLAESLGGRGLTAEPDVQVPGVDGRRGRRTIASGCAYTASPLLREPRSRTATARTSGTTPIARKTPSATTRAHSSVWNVPLIR